MMGVSQRRARTTGRWSARQQVCAGFTLTEMLVVIGIAVLLLAMLVPTGQSLREGNRMMSCKSQLHQIGQALKTYQMDEGAVPPYYVGADQDVTDEPHGPGLMQLYYSGYLARQESLHCPRDVYVEPGDAAYFASYSRKDEDVKTDTELNRYTYLSTRGIVNARDPITNEPNPLYFLQLQEAEDVGGTSPQPLVDRNWHPSDATVVTWCSFHVEHVEMGGAGQYNVLFWDGSVQRVGEHLMRPAVEGEDVGPDAAWKIGIWQWGLDAEDEEEEENGG